MGADIHMSLISTNGKCVVENLYEGRNYAWFDNITEHYSDIEYEDFPKIKGIPDCAPAEIKKIYEGVKNKDPEWLGYYGFYYVKVLDFLIWFEERKPYQKAGWVSKYNAFLYKSKGIIPKEEDVEPYYLLTDTPPENAEFIEYADYSEPSVGICDIVSTKSSLNDDIINGYIVYYFDR